MQTSRDVEQKHYGVHESSTLRLKFLSCGALLSCTVTNALFIEASKSSDGSFPYNSYVVPCLAEALKLCISALLLAFSKLSGNTCNTTFTRMRFVFFALPAACYFVSNNCTFFIVRELGPTTYQITCNLKVLATGILMRVFLGRRISWLRWKALVLLVLGTMITQLQSESIHARKNEIVGYFFVILNCFASAAGGVLSERLLKSNTHDDSIHWQNMQLYFFGLVFGCILSYSSSIHDWFSLFNGLNVWACACVVSIALSGLLVSFVLKYMDNFAKCFVASLAIVTVSAVETIISHETPHLNLVIGIIVTCMALDLYIVQQDV